MLRLGKTGVDAAPNSAIGPVFSPPQSDPLSHFPSPPSVDHRRRGSPSNSAQRVPHRLTCQPPCRERSESDQPRSRPGRQRGIRRRWALTFQAIQSGRGDDSEVGASTTLSTTSMIFSGTSPHRAHGAGSPSTTATVPSGSRSAVKKTTRPRRSRQAGQPASIVFRSSRWSRVRRLMPVLPDDTPAAERAEP